MSREPRRLTPDARARLTELKRRSKAGVRLEREDQLWVEAVFREYPEEFGEVDREVREWAMRSMNPLGTSFRIARWKSWDGYLGNRTPSELRELRDVFADGVALERKGYPDLLAARDLLVEDLRRG